MSREVRFRLDEVEFDLSCFESSQTQVRTNYVRLTPSQTESSFK